MDLGKVKSYADSGDLLADDSIDLVDVCTPTHLHEEMAVAAIEAGKHVLVEKAIALEIKQADAMLKAAQKAGKLLMVAYVLPFFPEFAFAAQASRGGEYSKLLAGHFTGSSPGPTGRPTSATPARPGTAGSSCMVSKIYLDKVTLASESGTKP